MLLTNRKAHMGKKQSRIGEHPYFFFVCIIITTMLICGCSSFNEGSQAKLTFKEANDLFSQGSYVASLSKYEQIIGKYPTTGDRVLFEMAIIYAYPRNEQKDYQKSLECLQKLIKDYPESGYCVCSAAIVLSLRVILLI
jgi:outer membrane protein assembly factor BamD (BamD/ComL family)